MNIWDAFISLFINAILLIYHYLGQNFGVAIILFTLIIRLVTHPLMVKQIKSSQAMQDFQKSPRWLEAQEKYKNDKEKLAQEQMAMYKEMGVSPFASCLPMLIQFPIIIALYQAIIQSLANTPMDLLKLVRHVNPALLNVEALIPLNNYFLGMNLGVPERLIQLPFWPFGISLLAVLVVITTYLQSKLMSPASASPNDQSAQMTGMMNLYMPVFMGFISWTLASGLSLYFVIANLFGILQYAVLGKANWRNLIPGRAPEKAVSTQEVKKSNRGKNGSRKNNARSHRANS